MKIEKKVLWEAFQEVVRVALFGAISTVVGFYLEKMAGLPQTEVVIIITLLLKFVDKYVHDSKHIKLNGLTDTKVFQLHS